MLDTQTILNAKNVSLSYVTSGWRAKKEVRAVQDVSLDVKQGETLGLVGESGCGKSSLARCLIRLHEPSSGSIEITGKDITKLSPHDLRVSRRDFQMIFQDPFTSLNPRMTVFDILAEPLKTHFAAMSKDDLRGRVHQLMLQVGLSPRYLHKYPHEFSGGQRQRVAIARALAVEPKLLVCDEPVAALDVSIQAQILNLLKSLQEQYNLAIVFIAHDLSVVRYISNRVAVMYLGRIVEYAPTETLFSKPLHPYTQALLSAIPTADPRSERTRQRIVLKGELPSPLNPPTGCAFHTRCPMADSLCKNERPKLVSYGDGQQLASCHKIPSQVSIEAPKKVPQTT